MVVVVGGLSDERRHRMWMCGCGCADVAVDVVLAVGDGNAWQCNSQSRKTTV